VTLIILRVADLAAALLDGLFEHPAVMFPIVLHVWAIEFLVRQQIFSAAC
jgi:hypothetical protein